MKPNFALNLSHDGIGLLHRGKSGWELVGEVALDAPDFGVRLTALRRAAKARAPEGVTTKIVVPASQILYTEIAAPGPQSAVRRRQIADALEGMTPYAVPDLAFDWCGQGEVVQVAVVARETLAEAEAFADDCGFCPVCFVAAPDPAQFAGEPWFGTTTAAPAHLPQGARIERDAETLPLDLLLARSAVAEPAAAEGVAALAEPMVAPVEPEGAAELAPAPEPEPAPAPDTEPVNDAEAGAQLSPETSAEERAAPVVEAIAPAAVLDAPILDAPQAADIMATEMAPTEPGMAEPALAETAGIPAAPEDTAPPTTAATTEELSSESLPTEQQPTELLAAVPETEPQTAPKTPPEPIAEPIAEASSAAAPSPSPEQMPTTAPAAEADTPIAARDSVDLIAALDDDRLTGFESVAPLKIDMPEPEPTAPRPAAAARKPLPGAARPGSVGKGRSAPPAAARPGQSPGAQKSGPRKPLLTGAERPEPAVAEPAPTPAPQRATPTPVAAVQTGPAAVERLRQMAQDGRRLATLGTAALETTAGKALAKARDKARALRPSVGIPDPRPAAEAPDLTSAEAKTVFGTRKANRIGGKPKYMGVTLLGGLVAFLAIAALWSSFLIAPETPPQPAEVASAPTATPPAAPRPETVAPETPAPDAQVPTNPATATPAAPAPLAPPQNDAPTAAPPAAAAPVAPPLAPQAPAAGAPLTLPALPTLPPVTTLPATQAPATSPAAPPAPAASVAAPTREGTLTAEGFTLFEGTPPSKSKPRPASVRRAAEKAAAAAADAAAPQVDPALKNARPKSRPASVAAAAAKAALAPQPPETPPTAAPAPAEAAPAPAVTPEDGASLAPGLSPDLAAVLKRAQPKQRPGSVERTAAAALAQAAAEKAAAEAKLAAEAAKAEAGLASSRRPMARPRNFDTSVQTALAAAIAAEPPPPARVAAIAAPEPQPALAPQKPVRAKPSPPPEPTVVSSPDIETGEVESAPVIPRGPTAASVAREATQKNALDLNRISLIGLYGTPSNRRALVRMPNGRFFKLQVGDRIDGGQVTAIGESQMTYQKGSRPITLKLLKGG